MPRRAFCLCSMTDVSSAHHCRLLQCMRIQRRVSKVNDSYKYGCSAAPFHTKFRVTFAVGCRCGCRCPEDAGQGQSSRLVRHSLLVVVLGTAPWPVLFVTLTDCAIASVGALHPVHRYLAETCPRLVPAGAFLAGHLRFWACCCSGRTYWMSKM